MSLEHSLARQERPKTERQRLTELQKIVQRRSWTILEWCAMRGYARAYFYTLRREKNAPATIGEGKAQRITDDADRDWQRKQEQKAKKAR
jgi:hypothetical protein